MKTVCGWFFSVFTFLGYQGATAQEIHSQFYSRFSFPEGLVANVLIQANDYAVWMAGKNYDNDKAFVLRCNYAGTLTWYTEFDGTPDQDEISSLAPAADGSCIFTYMHIYTPGKIGYGRIDSTGNVLWFRFYTGSNLNWTSSLQVIPFGNNFVLAGSRQTNFGSGGTMNLLRIDEDGNVLASGAYHCIPDRVKKIFRDSQGNILICGDYFVQFTSKAFLAKTDSNFQTFSLHHYKGAVEQVHDAVINSSDEILFSGIRWEDQGAEWSAALMKVNSSTSEVIWAKRLVSPDWQVSEFFGIEPGTDSASYFVIFEPEYFHGNTLPYQTTGILRFTENGISDTLFYRNDSTDFFQKLEPGKDKSYLEGFTDPNSNNGVIWKSSRLISDDPLAGTPLCFSGTTYDYPLSSVNVQSGTVTCTPDSLLTFLPDSLGQQFTSPSQEITCNFYWFTDDMATPVQEPVLNADISVLPNPCSEVFHLSSKSEMREIALTDVTGRTVLSETIYSQKQDIQVSRLPAGIYIAHLKFRDNTISIFKIQVERVTQR